MGPPDCHPYTVARPVRTDRLTGPGPESEMTAAGTLPPPGNDLIENVLRPVIPDDSPTTGRNIMKIAKFVVSSVVIVLAAGSVAAQDPATGLQDLIGAKGRDGEYQLQQRGYTWIRTEKTDDSAYSYWQEQENGQCITVRTTDGRYASIVYAPYSDCQGGGTTGGGASSYREDKFDTVCGVIVNGETYRYRCKAVDFYDGGKKVKTALHWPDQNMRLVWKSDNRVVLHFEGMKPMDATYASYEGETNFQFEDKTYFYISNKDMAAFEVKDLKD